MNEKSIFSIFTPKFNLGIEKSIVIVTCSAIPSFNKYFSEYFIFIPKNQTFFGHRFSASEKENAYIKIDFDYMYNKTIEWAQEELFYFWSESNLEKPNVLNISPDFTFKENNLLEYAELVASKKFNREITLIIHRSKCSELRNLTSKLHSGELFWDFNHSEIKSDEIIIQ